MQGLHQIEFLYEKNLFFQCKTLIKKIKKQAIKHEAYPILFEIMKWERMLAIAEQHAHTTEQYHLNQHSELLQYIAVYKNANEYLFHTLLINHFASKQGEYRTAEDRKKMDTLMANPLFQNEENALSFKAKYQFYFCQINYLIIQQDYKKAYAYAEKQALLTKEYSTPNFYISALKNISLCEYYLKNFTQSLISIDKLKHYAEPFAAKSDRIKNDIFLYATNAKIMIYIKTGEFAIVEDFLMSIQEELKLTSREETNIIFLNYMIAVAYFGAGNYTLANQYFNKIINSKASKRYDVACLTQIMSLIVHFELGNQELLKFKVKSVYRFLNTKKRLYKFETIILNFIRTESKKITSKKSIQQAFKNLKEELEECFKDSTEKRIVDYFDFIAWLTSKIENKPFATVVKENLRLATTL